MVYQRKSGMDGKLKTIAVCVTTLLLSLASFDAARGAITNTTQNNTYNTIQAAVDGANAGESILLDTGFYLLSEAVTITDKALTISGALEAATFIHLSNARSDNVFTINANGLSVTLEKLTIRFGDYGVKSTAGNVNVNNCTFQLNGYSGIPYSNSPTAANTAITWAAQASDGGAIRIENSSSSEIGDCTLLTNDSGITLVDCTNGNIHDNTITGSNQSGIHLGSSSGTGSKGCASTTVEDNTCSTNKENGIKSVGGLSNTITGNTCADNWNAGIMVSHPGQITVQTSTLTGNNAYAFSGKGLTGNAAGSIHVTGTTGDAAATWALKLLNNTISSGSAGGAASATGLNIESAPASSAISVGTSGNGNTFSGVSVDILVQANAADTTVRDNSLGSTAGIQNDDTGNTLAATYNWWGDETGPGGTGSGAGKTVSTDVTYSPWWELSAMRATVTTFTLRAPTVLGPVEPIKVYLDLTSDWAKISSIGARLTYDSSKVSFTSLAMGSGVPNSWSATYSATGTAGEIDVVIKDANSADNITSAPSSLEVLAITFTGVSSNCTPAVAFAYNATDGDGSNMETEGKYIKRVNTQSNTIVEATTTNNTVAGPTVTDYAFIRGNVNNRLSHRLDLSDVIDLAAYLYSGLTFSFDCAAAKDVNNDGAEDISDVVTLVQAIFNTSGVTIAAPNFSDPGVGVPGVVAGNGGAIASQLSCAEGETCN